MDMETQSKATEVAPWGPLAGRPPFAGSGQALRGRNPVRVGGRPALRPLEAISNRWLCGADRLKSGHEGRWPGVHPSQAQGKLCVDATPSA